MLVSYVAGEGVELTVHKENVAVEEIKKVELRSRRAHFIYEKNCNRIELQPRGHAPPVKKLRRLLHKRRKVRVFVWEGIRKNIISLRFFNLFIQIFGRIWTVVGRGYFSHASLYRENVRSQGIINIKLKQNQTTFA